MIASPFDLPWGSSVYATIIATNLVGDSIVSDEGNGARILTYPDPPTALANDPTQTSATKILFTYLDGTEDGGTPIIDYRVSYKPSSELTFNVLATGVTDQYYSSESLQSGVEYDFKLESRNAFGYSLTFSEVVTIL